MKKVYVYESAETARAVGMTVKFTDEDAFVFVAGSAVVMDEDVFDNLMSKTYAPLPVIVAVEEAHDATVS
jgi:glutamine amidotransferase-like uncharacterized protein